jgi:hypothetical protein
MSFVCGSCGRKGLSGTTVDGGLVEGDFYFNEGKYDNARRSYQKALNILKENGGCKRCIELIEERIDECKEKIGL